MAALLVHNPIVLQGTSTFQNKGQRRKVQQDEGFLLSFLVDFVCKRNRIHYCNKSRFLGDPCNEYVFGQNTSV